MSQYLPRIHDVLRVQRLFDSPHQLQFQRRLVAGQIVLLQRADAVFGRNRTAKAVDLVMHDAVDRILVGQEIAVRHAGRRRHVVVQVAVAQVAEAHELAAGEGRCQGRIRDGDEIGDAGNRQRDIVLDVLARLRLRQRDVFTQLP